jgi:PAS domain-containing protein
MMDQTRQLLSEMGSEEDRLLTIRTSGLEMVGTLLQIGAATVFLLICAVGVLVSVYARRSFAELTAAHDKLAVTNQQLIEQMEERQQSKARLQLALDAARLGWWQYDPRHRVISGDARFKELIGVTADETPIEEIRKRVHPDDGERVRANSEASFDPLILSVVAAIAHQTVAGSQRFHSALL